MNTDVLPATVSPTEGVPVPHTQPRLHLPAMLFGELFASLVTSVTSYAPPSTLPTYLRRLANFLPNHLPLIALIVLDGLQQSRTLHTISILLPTHSAAVRRTKLLTSSSANSA